MNHDLYQFQMLGARIVRGGVHSYPISRTPSPPLRVGFFSVE